MMTMSTTRTGARTVLVCAILALPSIGVPTTVGRAVAAPPPEVRPQPNPHGQREILMLFSEDVTQPWTQRIAQGVGEVVMHRAPGPVLYYEYIDIARFREPGDLVAFRDWLKTKYATRDIDLIVPLGEPAMAFVASYRATLFPRADVYFLSLRPPDGFFVSHIPYAGGIVLEDNLPATLVVLKAMLPGTRRVAVVSGASQSEQAWAGSVPDIVQRADLEFVKVPLLPIPELLKYVGRLPEGTILLVLGPIVDSNALT